MTATTPASPPFQTLHGRAPLITLEQVGVRYGSHWALRGVNLEILHGEMLAFIGPNGAGKSTLLKALLGLVPLAEGSIVRVGQAPRIGYVPQKLALDPAFPLTVEEFLAVNHPGPRAWFGGVSKAQRPTIMAALERMGAADISRQLVGTLSGGQFQRVMLASALLQNPSLLLLDEPSASIDRRGSEELQLLLHDLHEKLALTILFVSHDLHFVSHLATRVGCLNRNFCGLGPPHEVLSEHFLTEAYGTAFASGHLHFHPAG